MPKQFVRLGCGIDISSKQLDVCFGGYLQDGAFCVIATRKSFKNTVVDIKRLTKWIKGLWTKHRPEKDCDFQVVMEVTGSYHENTLAELHHTGLPVCLEGSAKVKRYLQSIGQYSKNDELDARGICRLACERKLRRWEPFSEQTMELRGVLRQRHSLITSRTRYKNQLHAAMAGHYANRHVKKTIKAMIKQLDQQIALLEKEVCRLYQLDDKLVKSVQTIVDSLPGVGLLSVLTIFAETNGFAMIKSRRALSRYVGLNVIQNQSGMSTRPTRIAKRGNERIRSTMYMCALSMIRFGEGQIVAKYRRIARKNEKAKKVAVTALMRGMLELVYTLYKSGKAYDPNHIWTQSKPKANSPSTANKDAPEEHSEARGITDSEESLPMVA